MSLKTQVPLLGQVVFSNNVLSKLFFFSFEFCSFKKAYFFYFLSFEFRSFKNEVRVGQDRLGDLGNVRGRKNGLRGG